MIPLVIGISFLLIFLLILHSQKILAKHIMNVHMNANKAKSAPKEGEISLPVLKKFIHYCRTRCGPRLSVEAGEKLKSRYVLMRAGASQQEKAADKRLSIPITVR